MTGVWAVEPSDVAWRLAQPRVGARGVPVVRAGLDGAALELPDARFDAALSTFTLCTIPDSSAALRQVRRVLKPGGLFVLVDSLQRGDAPGYDGLLERFPEGFHEPYYASYLDEDLAAIFGEAGLALRSVDRAWLTKVASFERPANEV